MGDVVDWNSKERKREREMVEDVRVVDDGSGGLERLQSQGLAVIAGVRNHGSR